MMKIKYLIIASLLSIVESTIAGVKPASIFGDGMVLQRESRVPIWGTSDKNKNILLITSWDQRTYNVESDNQGNWEVMVQTPQAGGPYKIDISDGEEITVNDVMIGEVWLCSGQSNMEWPMKGRNSQPVLGANEAIVKSYNNNIRLFTIQKSKSANPESTFVGEWEVSQPESVADFSATAYFFGTTLEQVLDVPIGLICSSWGGTRIEPWISSQGFSTIDFVDTPKEMKEQEISHQTPTVLFNAMINPMVGYGIRGVIWYQGESNRNQPEQYLKLLPALIKDWRTKWGIGEFPFYFAQIAPYDYGSSGINSAYLRESQFKASNLIDNTGMASLMDIGEEHCIHPSNKKITGKRLAYIALAKTYNVAGIEYSGPVYKEMVVKDSLVTLVFQHALTGLTTYGKPLKHFKVAGNDQVFYTAQARITRGRIELYSKYVPHPVAVRYAFEDFVVGELYNLYGLPASSFRTDNWALEQVETSNSEK